MYSRPPRTSRWQCIGIPVGDFILTPRTLKPIDSNSRSALSDLKLETCWADPV